MIHPFIVTCRVKHTPHYVVIARCFDKVEAKALGAATLNAKWQTYDRVHVSYRGVVIASNGAHS